KYFVREENGEGNFSRKILQNLENDSYREIALNLAYEGIECFAYCFLHPKTKECEKIARYIISTQMRFNPKIVEEAQKILNILERREKNAQEQKEARWNKMMKKKVLSILENRNKKTQEQKETRWNKMKKTANSFARQANNPDAKKAF
ncbi:MAG: hypothetical protein II835_17775, partial [Fibrobacter sp.]|nr:hypothetical protein [Fibrobacter sp.]